MLDRKDCKTMAVVTWLTEQLTPDEKNHLALRDIYDTYKIENILQVDHIVPSTMFGQILQKVLNTKSKMKKINGIVQTVYSLNWKTNDSTMPEESLKTVKLKENLPMKLHVIETGEDYVLCIRDTGTQCNSNDILKYVKFEAGRYSLTVRKRDINLVENSISGTYVNSVESLFNVLHQIDSINLCHGIEVKNRKYKKYANHFEEKLNVGGNEFLVLRSVHCKMVTELTCYKGQTCKSCKRMTIHFEDTKHEEENKLNTEEIIKKLMPNADPKLLSFILSQIKNSNTVNSCQNQWDWNTVSECLAWYTRSPESYRQVRESGLVILPSPELLILYKNS